MIGWVGSLCEDWGAHKRWVYADIVHPIPSVLGRIREERDGASYRAPSQYTPEVFSPNSLVISRAIIGIPAELLAVLVIEYIYDAPLAKRPILVGQLHGKPISLRTYWRRLHRAHCFIASKLKVPPDSAAA